MNLKQFNAKQAERWLQKLKNENLQSYKDITKFLRKYEKTDDEYDCYVKISHTLLSHVELTKQINLFLEDGNKFVVSRPDDEKLKDFMGYVKKSRPEIFNKIINMIQQLSKSKGEGNNEVSKMIIPKLKEIVMGDVELERLTEEALDMTDEQLIRRKNIEHLKVTRGLLQIPEEPKEGQPSQSQPARQRKNGANQLKNTDNFKQQKKILKTQQIGNLTNSIEERSVIKQFQKSTEQKTYWYVVKLIKLYSLNIITRNQINELLSNVGIQEVYLDCIKQILETRELDRRKNSVFKPLGDINFSSHERASPSYVTVPPYYPIKCSGKNSQTRSLTNDRWISVPYGSEENQNFNVRNKNTNEINLLKAEDQRYQYHIYLKKLTKTLELLDKFLDQSNGLDEEGREVILRKVINLGIFQILYKNCRDDQKQEIQCLLRSNPYETCKFFRDKIEAQVLQLRQIKQIHANKVWNEIAIKNFYKALDLKGFEFKKNEKQKMKNTFFISQLNERIKIIDNGGQLKNNLMSFDEKKDFFRILNSFQVSSRTQKCNNRSLPIFQSFDLKDQQQRSFYPLMILSFEDQQICEYLYSLLIFYIETGQITEGQKLKCKIFLQQILGGILGWKLPIKKTLSQQFNEDALYQKISSMDLQYDYSKNFIIETEESLLKPSVRNRADELPKTKKMRTLQDNTSRYSYLPKKQADKKVLYCSENVYCLIRYLYTIYERLIKMKDVAQHADSTKLFELLFYACIKAKEGIRFQENLNSLFGKHAYLFGTIYKLFDSLLKSISLSSNCLLTSNSLKFMEEQECEDLYFLLVNRFCMSNNLSSNKLVRMTYQTTDKVIYFNYLDCYYKSPDDVGKDVSKKRAEISRGVEMYTTDYYGSEGRKIRKLNEYYESNEMQHIFEGSTIKMLNHSQNEDLMLQKNKRSNFLKSVKRELKRVHKLCYLTG